MICTKCGCKKKYDDRKAQRCNFCGSAFKLDADDFLLHSARNLVSEVRQGQVEMGQAVERVIARNGVGIIEAPVGSGKSYAYSIPALLSGKRVVISTAKKQLQHQLAGSDLPRLVQCLESSAKITLIKGKSNYMCRMRVAGLKEPAEKQSALDFLDAAEYGDSSEWVGARPKFWNKANAEDCLGKACSYATKCGYLKAKALAKTAQVVVANHALVAFDLRYGPFSILGHYDTLIVDEAHQAEQSFRGAYGTKLSQYTAQKLHASAVELAVFDDTLLATLKKAWQDMFLHIRFLQGRIAKDPFGAPGLATEAILGQVKSALTAYQAQAGIRVRNTPFGEQPDLAGLDEDQRYEAMQVFVLKKSLDKVSTSLVTIRDPHDNDLIHIGESEAGSRHVIVEPINLGPLIGPKLAMIPSVIFTSATLAVNGEFTAFKWSMGVNRMLDPPPPKEDLPEPIEEGEIEKWVDPVGNGKDRYTEELTVASPFDFTKQAMLYTPTNTPMPAKAGDPRRMDYLVKLTAHIKDVLMASRGSAFVLWTNRSDMEESAKLLLASGYADPLIVHGDDPVNDEKMFRSTPRATLYGTKTFWEGVNIEGDTLHTVILTKFPFAPPDDPLTSAKKGVRIRELMAKGILERAASGTAFMELDLPAVITDVRQGAGRLIRTRKDEGLLAILDPRVWSGSSTYGYEPGQKTYRGYGAQVVKALGFGTRTDQLTAIQTYFRIFFLKRAPKPVSSRPQV